MVNSPAGNDEIGFVEIWLTVKNSRIFILSFTLLFTVAALLYVLLTPNKYKTEAILLPPMLSDIDTMNVIPDLYNLTPGYVYTSMIDNLKSHSLRREFFLKNNLYDALKSSEIDENSENEVFEKRFNKMITIIVPPVQGTELPVITIGFEGDQPEQITDWLNDYVVFADQFTLESIRKNIETKVSIQIQKLQTEVDMQLKIGEKERLDEITRIEEAALIARKLGLENQAEVPYYSYNQAIQAGTGVVLNQSSTPDYLKGYKALEAEAEALKKRESEESFVPGVRKLQEQILELKTRMSTFEPGHSSRIDREAQVPLAPFAPKKILLVGMGFFTGLFGAVALVVLRSMFLSAGRNLSGQI